MLKVSVVVYLKFKYNWCHAFYLAALEDGTWAWTFFKGSHLIQMYSQS